MREVTGVRVMSLALVALGSAVASLGLLRLWRGTIGDYPQLSWIGVIPLAMVIVLVLVAGRQVQRYQAGDPVPVMTPQRARGTLVAAQASAWGGAALTGWFIAHALVHAPNADVASVRELMIRALVSACAAILLAVAGMIAQHWCRLPPEDDDDDEPPRGYDATPI